MKKYNKIEIEIISFEETDVITTSTTETPQKLTTWGFMTKNVDSEDSDLFR